jgi:hypothetical protein
MRKDWGNKSRNTGRKKYGKERCIVEMQGK